VVISIIALLIAMLLPALGKARETAQQVQCASNMRQIGIAFANYLGEYRSTYPYVDPWVNFNPVTLAGDRAGGHRPWQYALRAYLGDLRQNTAPPVLQCPTNPFEPLWHNNNGFIATNYGMNRSALPFEQTNWVPVYVPPKTEEDFRFASSTLIVGELPNGTFASAGSTPPSGYNTHFYYNHVQGDDFYNPQWPDRWFPNRLMTHWARLPHNDGWNGLKMDGHVSVDNVEFLRDTATRGIAWGQAGPGRIFWRGF